MHSAFMFVKKLLLAAVMAPRGAETSDDFEVEETEKIKSSLGFKYSRLRDHKLHSGFQWLEGKREDDGAEGFWRIHDGLYDLKDFIDKHPGGADWIKLTRGTDITEAFESQHVFPKAEKILPKYFIKNASTKRNSPFTFKPDGFYRVLKQRVAEFLPNVPERAALKSNIMTDMLMAGFLMSAFGAGYLRSPILGGVAGILLSCTAIAAHNYFHQKDNFRMYYFDMTMMHSREWRISHALSHHLYTNTINDLEISAFEPWLQYLPIEKNFIFKYLSWVYSPVVYMFLFFGHSIRTNLQYALNRKFVPWASFLPLMLLLLLFVASLDAVFAIIMFVLIEVVASVHFGVVGVNAAHHHPDIFHDGDTPRSDMDWGLYQLDAVMDRKDITGSHFLVLTNFGDHALHHLFPTVDHGKLNYLYPVFLQTCKDFGIEWRLTSQMELVKGQFLQLARTEPNTEPPKWINDQSKAQK